MRQRLTRDCLGLGSQTVAGQSLSGASESAFHLRSGGSFWQSSENSDSDIRGRKFEGYCVSTSTHSHTNCWQPIPIPWLLFATTVSSRKNGVSSTSTFRVTAAFGCQSGQIENGLRESVSERPNTALEPSAVGFYTVLQK